MTYDRAITVNLAERINKNFYKSTQEALDEYDFEFIERRMSEEEFLKELEEW